MSQEELVEYVFGFDDMSLVGLNGNQYKWSFSYLSKEEFIERYHEPSKEEGWIEWLEGERIERIEHYGYDNIQEIETYWLQNPAYEPVILVITKENTLEVYDGYHRIGIAMKHDLGRMPILLGEKIEIRKKHLL